MFKKILVANRGEIAVRVIRACRDLGISPVAVYSEADRESLSVTLSDEAYCLGEAPASKSYLDIDKIISAAREADAEAIHPGYGFLAENDDLVRACENNDLVFIGPSAVSMSTMGDKLASRAAVKRAGVPVVPGSDGALQSLDEAVEQAGRIGYPLMLKASAGGGGKGLRLVHSQEDLQEVYETTRGEAESSFKDPTLFFEKYIERPRHIEIQVLGDLKGNLIHLGERECSIQRRHQKVVEECPSPLVGEGFRQRLGGAAIAVARAVDYYNAGTVEFLVDAGVESDSPPFYFLEMNTRLQVEHPVTEMVTGIDLVREQILIAAGQRLQYSQPDVQWQGWALECRIYAEDPRNNFFPSPGTLTTLFEPSGPGIRNDSGVCAGSTIPVHYDPLISKLIAHGRDRSEAIARMRRALKEYKVSGVRTTIPFFDALLSHPEFVKGNLHTHFIEEHGLIRSSPATEQLPVVASALHYYLEKSSRAPGKRAKRSAWKEYGRFSSLD